MSNPTFTIYTGPMFGSKTTRLLGDVDRLNYRGKNVLAVKPKIDTRYSTDEITSHNGGSIKAICIEDAKELYNFIDYKSFSTSLYETVAVDEAFMIKNIDEVLIDFFRNDISIIVSSIQLDAKEKPFENIKNMMPFATKIEICPAVCTMCDKDAYYTEALFDIENTSQEERLGSKSMYEPRCYRHYSSFNKGLNNE